jgi:hypothetical protein
MKAPTFPQASWMVFLLHEVMALPVPNMLIMPAGTGALPRPAAHFSNPTAVNLVPVNIFVNFVVFCTFHLLRSALNLDALANTLSMFVTESVIHLLMPAWPSNNCAFVFPFFNCFPAAFLLIENDNFMSVTGLTSHSSRAPHLLVATVVSRLTTSHDASLKAAVDIGVAPPTTSIQSSAMLKVIDFLTDAALPGCWGERGSNASK